MRGLATLVGLVVALGGGYLVYQSSLTRSNLVEEPPLQQIDTVGISSELMSIGLAERQYLVTHGTYATVAQLEEDGLLVGGADRRGYTFRASVDGSRGFTVTATPSDADKAGWPTLVITETMQVTRQ